MDKNTRNISDDDRATLFRALSTRFEKHMERHPDIHWAEVQARLEAQPEKLWSLREMERTGGEPDVVGQDDASGEFSFFDCSQESPLGRRNLCYDRAAREARKVAQPQGSALETAAEMGIELLTETQTRFLQSLGKFDTKTSSWVLTPPEIRQRGGALFMDRRYEAIFVYHNGADSYYAARGFHGSLRV
jgi:hypothetical protein